MRSVQPGRSLTRALFQQSHTHQRAALCERQRAPAQWPKRLFHRDVEVLPFELSRYSQIEAHRQVTAAGQQKEGAAAHGHRPIFASLRRLEVQRRAGEDVAAEVIVSAPVGIAVTGRDSAGAEAAAEERRRPVEDIVDAQPEVVVVANREGRGEIEVALRRYVAVQ